MRETFTARDVTLLDIFNHSSPYKIPKYQRAYEWSLDNAQEFLEDLISDDAEIFLGSFVFDVSKEESGYVEIIDGQQRLTTILIFVSALWRLNIKNGFHDGGSTNVDRLFFKNPHTGKGGLPRLDASEKINDFLISTLLNPNWDQTFKTKLSDYETSVKEIYEYFYAEIDKHLSIKIPEERETFIINLNTKLFTSKVVRITVQGDDIAYMLFEVLNARGEPLNVSDLLKNYILSQISLQSGPDAVSEAEATWKEIEKTVSGVKKINMPKFIRYYWIGQNKFVTEKNLYKNIKRSKIDAPLLLSNLKVASNWLNLFANGSLEDWEKELEGSKLDYKEIFRGIEGIRVFETTQCYVLFLSLLMQKDNISYDFSKIFTQIEKFHFHYSAINKQPGNAVEKLFQSTALKNCESIKTSGETQPILQELINVLPVKLQYEQFEQNFKKLSYTRNKHLVRYIFDRFETKLTDYKHRPGFLDDIGKSQRAMKFTVDHIIPQDEKVLKDFDADSIDKIHSIGNLLLVERELNGYMSNDLPQTKIQKLAKSKLDIARDFAKTYSKDFTLNDVGSRGEELSKFAYGNLC